MYQRAENSNGAIEELEIRNNSVTCVLYFEENRSEFGRFKRGE